MKKQSKKSRHAEQVEPIPRRSNQMKTVIEQPVELTR